jgi:2-oxoglutarate/2-oxoacid ferredoxin oxidoreductase subunit beta
MPKVGGDLRRYLRVESMPHVWCPGCGHGQVAHGLAAALDRLAVPLDRLVLVGGIGCSGRTPFYFNANAMHTTHGRALAFATGIKLTRPELTVITTMGDGDTAAIGGNHFIHACRRNIDLTAIVYNNGIYGMTGGQQAPTTPLGARSATTPLGSLEPAFDIVQLALAAGASFVARTTTFDFEEMPTLIVDAVRHPGFAVVEVLTQCPTYFGRLNQLGDAVAMLDYERDMTLPQEEITKEKLAGRMPLGVFRREVRPEYTVQYAALCARQKAGAEKAEVAP